MTDSDEGNPAGDRDGAEGASGDLRLTAPADDGRPPRLPFPVVGVGASAGGLEAYTAFLAAAPPDAGLAFVLVQHLPPDRESLIAEILSRHTAMPVSQVEDGQAVEPNHVYVIRPGHTLTIADGRLHLGKELATRGHGRPVDDFFRSLAEEQQQRAVAIVLSGMGTNGTAGAEAVKAVGGLVIAQDPDTAKFPPMPRSLIDAGLADFVLPPADMPAAVLRYARHPYATAEDAAVAQARREHLALAEILAVLRTRTRHDFTGYRQPTVLRRIQRRMGLAQVGTMGDYAKTLRQAAGEVTALADDLLIHVTGFFRDPEAWAALAEKVIAPLVADRAAVRCWVAACATGEEAYTLAMLLDEAAGHAGKRLEVKVFATDMAERALGRARAGLFPNGIESEVTPERLARFFDKEDDTYRVKRAIRERVVFAPQNVLQDPPFSRMDIVSCRNLLIYLEPDAQKRVLSLLHFGLRDGGALMLGSSESVAAGGGLEPIDRKHRLFRRVGPARNGPHQFVLAAGPARPALPNPSEGPPANRASVAQLAGRALLDEYTPAAVVADAGGQMVHVHGDTGRYLALPPGGPTHDLLALARDEVRGAVRTALHRAAEAQARVSVRDGVIHTPDGPRRVEVGAAPLDRRATAPLYLVTFRDHPAPTPAPPDTDGAPATADGLADELARTRDELQSALEEMQTSAEEARASHEEVTSTNEELQSTNEELETSKEELQSLNEELTTVNAQLQAKMTELEATGNDLSSLLTSTDIAVVFLDTTLRIRRYTPAVRDLLDLIPADIGRPLADLHRKFADPGLMADVRAVLDKLAPLEQEVASDSGRTYLRRALPYRTTDRRIDGVVVAFLDVTDRTAAEAERRSTEARYRALASNLPDGAAFVIGPDLRYQLAGGEALERVGLSPEQLEGKTPAEALPPALAERYIALCRQALAGEPARMEFEADGRHYVTRGLPLREGGAIMAVVAVSYDITDRKRAEDALRASEEQFRLLVENVRDHAIFGIAPDGVVTSWNEAAERLFGYSAAEAVGQSSDRFFTPEDRAAGLFERERATAAAEGRAMDDNWLVRKDGSRFWASGSSSAMRSAAGGLTGFVKVVRDRTEARAAAESVRQAEEQLRLALQAARMGAWRWDIAADRQSRDAHLNWLLGLAAEPSAATLSDFLGHIHPDDRPAVADAFDHTARHGGSLNTEFRVEGPDGTTRWLRDQGDVFGTGDGRYLTGVAVDVTPLKGAETALRAARDELEVRVAERTAELNAAVAELEAEAALREEAEAARQELLGRLAVVHEEERTRIARELHDSLGQYLTGMALGLANLRNRLPADRAERADLERLTELSAEMSREAHRLATELRPTALDDAGLDAAVQTYVEGWAERTGVPAQFGDRGFEAGKVPELAASTAYRAVQECLTNVARHAAATRVSVLLDRKPDGLEVIVEDDGRGFDPAAPPADARRRLGMLGMKERVALAGGRVEVESAPGAGTTVFIRLPFPTGAP